MRCPNRLIYKTYRQGMGEELGVTVTGMGLLLGEMKKIFFFEANPQISQIGFQLVVKAGLKFPIFLSPGPKCWNYRHAMPVWWEEILCNRVVVFDAEPCERTDPHILGWLKWRVLCYVTFILIKNGILQVLNDI